MVSCQVQTVVHQVVKANAPNERVYQLSYADQRDSDSGFKLLRYICNSSFICRHTRDINVLYNLSVSTYMFAMYVSLCGLSSGRCNRYNYSENDPKANTMLSQALSIPLA